MRPAVGKQDEDHDRDTYRKQQTCHGDESPAQTGTRHGRDGSQTRGERA
jgi:hypothetical protein